MYNSRSSPRPWGCFPFGLSCSRFLRFFPTPVGVFLAPCFSITLEKPLPHARGGVSEGTEEWAYASASSPRPWGCFSLKTRGKIMEALFPTPVGVFPARCSPLSFQEPLPHARGGVSTVGRNNGRENCSSPRPWGCFLKRREIRWLKTLFPTPVGVFLYPYPLLRKCRTLPHARGGVSAILPRIATAFRSSPRTWGCFSFRSPARKRL